MTTGEELANISQQYYRKKKKITLTEVIIDILASKLVLF